MKRAKKGKTKWLPQKGNTFYTWTCLLLLQQHHDFEEKHIVDHHFLVLVQDLKGFAADDIIQDRRWEGQVGAWTWSMEIWKCGYNGRHAAAIMCCLYELLGAKFLIHVVLTGSNPPFKQRAKRRKKIQ